MNKIISIFLLFIPLGLFAQQQLTGKIISKEDKSALPGVSVFVKGTANGTLADIDGKFTINATRGDTIVFSFIGLKTVERVVTAKTEMFVTMQNDVNILDDVVVSVGYFNVKKKDLTGSISQIGSEDLENNRTTSVENMLQGQVAGVVVSESSEPGGGVSISIRGTNSMLGGTQPLYVVDGIPIDPLVDAEGNSGAGQAQSSLSFINPADIDKIEILKDATATAIYGARGANGVIVITTKETKIGKNINKFQVSTDFTLTDIVKNIGVMNGSQFENYMNQRAINEFYKNITDPSRTGVVFDGSQAFTGMTFDDLTLNLPYTESTGISTNWQDEVYRKAYSKNVNLNYSGASNSNSVSISAGFSNNQGVILNSDYQRATYNMNIRRSIWDSKINLFSKTNASYSKGKASSVGNGQMYQDRGIVSLAQRFQPIFSQLELGQDDDIYAELNEGNLLSNPYTIAEYVTDIKQAITLNQSLSILGEITDKLSVTGKFSGNYQRSVRDSYYPTNTTRGRRNGGEASQSYLQNMKMYSEANIHYQNNFGKHAVDAIAVATYEKNFLRVLYNKAYGFGSDRTSYYTFESATDILVPIHNYNTQALLSGLFRVGYNYKSTYYLDLNARADASSKFAANHRTAIFPAVAFAWTVSNEKFMKHISAISNMKLRLSYGKTGSNPIKPYQSLALMSPIRYNFNNQLVTGYYEQNLSNDDLTWETTDQYNIGLDLAVLDSRFNITLDVYKKNTHDLLQYVNLPSSNGYATRVDNFGEVENKGIELALSGKILKDKKLKWRAVGTFALNRNKLIELNSNLEYQLGPAVGYDKTYPTMFMVGKPLGIFWGAETDGIYSNWEADASGLPTTAGEIKYVNHHIDTDANGNPLANQNIDSKDYVQIGDPNPDFTVSLKNSFTYKKFDLNILLIGQKGGDILWVDSWPLMGLSKSTNVLQSAFEDSWIAPISVDAENGTITYDESVGNTSGVTNPAAYTDAGSRAIVSDRQVFDGSYISIKNVNFGYTFKLKSKKQGLRVYASGRNLYTFTKYPGYSPEISTFSKDPQRRGIDFGAYPASRSIVFGLKLNI